MKLSISINVSERFQWFNDLLRIGIALDLLTRAPIIVASALECDLSWWIVWQTLLYAALSLVALAQLIILLIVKLQTPQEVDSKDIRDMIASMAVV